MPLHIQRGFSQLVHELLCKSIAAVQLDSRKMPWFDVQVPDQTVLILCSLFRHLYPPISCLQRLSLTRVSPAFRCRRKVLKGISKSSAARSWVGAGWR